MVGQSNWIGVDIGGANIKLASNALATRERPFALWKNPRGLRRCLEELLAEYDRPNPVAAAMTGELADCFATREQGVIAITRSLNAAAGERDVRWYSLHGEWGTMEDVLDSPADFAASNWLALSEFAARHHPHGNGVLLDIGTTTTDIIPMHDGHAAPTGRRDTDRLLNDELVYVGVERTPLCAVLTDAPYRGRHVPTAAEFFASSLDVFVLLGDLPESMDSHHTADGRAATRAASVRRMARTVLAIGAGEFGEADALEIAREARARLIERIGRSLRSVCQRFAIDPANTVCSGRGRFLGEQVLRSLGVETDGIAILGPELEGVRNCGTARALAWLAQHDVRVL